MKKVSVLIVFALMLILAGCEGSKSAKFVPTIGAKLIGGSSSSSITKSVDREVASTPQIDALGMQQLEIVAYQYSPGYTDDSGFANKGIINNWAYDVICQGGLVQSRIVESGKTVDITDFTNGYVTPISDKFIATHSSFSVDFLEVYIHVPGIFVNNYYYGEEAGGNDFSYIKTYAQFANVIPVYCASSTSAFLGQTNCINALLARSDWFPNAVAIKLEPAQSAVGYEITSVIGDLSGIIIFADGSTISQKDMILSMVNNGTERRSYDTIFIVPYGAPVQVATTENGVGIKNPQANIVFNFDWSSMITPATQSAIENGTIIMHSSNETMLSGSPVVFQVTNNIPLGMSCTITDPSIVPATN